MQGKVIAIIAPTRSGKTFLAEKLAAHYGVPALHEQGPEGLPERVKKAIAHQGNPLDGWMYFRNRSLAMQREAIELAKSHRAVFIDAAWVSNAPYAVFYKGDEFDRAIIESVSQSDAALLPWPDIVIVLTSDDASSEKLWRLADRSFEHGEGYFEERLLPLKRAFEAHIDTLTIPVPHIRIDRSHLDFSKPEDLQKVIEQLDPLL